MPAALGFIGAAISGALAGFGAAGGMAAAFGTAVLGTVLGTVAGVALYGLNLLLAPGVANTSTPSGVSFTDTGLRFDPTPNFTSAQQVIPLVFGKTTVSPQIAHRRVYGTNYQKGFFFLACGEAPLDLHSILIDDVNIGDLPNYSNTPGDRSKSWYMQNYIYYDGRGQYGCDSIQQGVLDAHRRQCAHIRGQGYGRHRRGRLHGYP